MISASVTSDGSCSRRLEAELVEVKDTILNSSGGVSKGQGKIAAPERLVNECLGKELWYIHAFEQKPLTSEQ